MKTNSKIKLFFALITLLSFVNLNAQNLIKAAEVTPAYLKIICATNGITVSEMKDNFIKINNGIDMYLDIDEKNDSAYGFKKFDNKIYFYEKSNQGDILYQTNIETSEKLNISK